MTEILLAFLPLSFCLAMTLATLKRNQPMQILWLGIGYMALFLGTGVLLSVLIHNLSKNHLTLGFLFVIVKM